MGKIEKILKKWETKPKEISKDEVINVLKRFGFELDFKRGSHIVVRHELLKNQANFGQNGEFTVPVKGGKSVKGYYIKEILFAIELIQEGD